MNRRSKPNLLQKPKNKKHLEFCIIGTKGCKSEVSYASHILLFFVILFQGERKKTTYKSSNYLDFVNLKGLTCFDICRRLLCSNIVFYLPVSEHSCERCQIPCHLVLVMSSEAKSLRPKILPFLGLYTHSQKKISLLGLSPTHNMWHTVASMKKSSFNTSV